MSLEAPPTQNAQVQQDYKTNLAWDPRAWAPNPTRADLGAVKVSKHWSQNRPTGPKCSHVSFA